MAGNIVRSFFSSLLIVAGAVIWLKFDQTYLGLGFGMLGVLGVLGFNIFSGGVFHQKTDSGDSQEESTLLLIIFASQSTKEMAAEILQKDIAPICQTGTLVHGFLEPTDTRLHVMSVVLRAGMDDIMNIGQTLSKRLGDTIWIVPFFGWKDSWACMKFNTTGEICGFAEIPSTLKGWSGMIEVRTTKDFLADAFGNSSLDFVSKDMLRELVRGTGTGNSEINVEFFVDQK